MGTFFDAFAQADFFGKLIFFALFLLSSACWMYIVRKFLSINKAKKRSKEFEKITQLYKEKLLTIDIKKYSPYSHLYQSFKEKVLIILDKNYYYSSEVKKNHNYLSHIDIDYLSANLHADVIKLKEKMESNLFVLSTTITLAPFLGLLGTVWGILITFGELQNGSLVSSNSVILGGLSTALTTTVLGLLIAIPALVGYNYLKNLCRQYIIEMHNFCQFLLSTVEIQYRKVDIK